MRPTESPALTSGLPTRRIAVVALSVVAIVGSSVGGGAAARDGAARDGGPLDAWLRDLAHPDPFVSRRGESEIRQLGDEALIPLATRWHSLTSTDEQPVLDTLLLLRIEDLLDGLLRDFLAQLESEYRALELDRRELQQLAERKKSLVELLQLRKKLPNWEKIPGFGDKAKIWYDWRRLLTRQERGDEVEQSLCVSTAAEDTRALHTRRTNRHVYTYTHGATEHAEAGRTRDW